MTLPDLALYSTPQSELDELPFARTLVCAPHPDDESIGAGALIAEIVNRGGVVRVVFMTNGDNNPWPQRFARRRWRISAHDQREWGRLRRGEARRAISILGLSPQSATFLGLPDDGLAVLDRDMVANRIATTLREFQPTLLIIPSIDDFHPDHRATHRAVLRAVSRLDRRPTMILSYIVHGRASDAYRGLDPVERQLDKKRAAIGCHASQLLLSRGRFTRYARRPERFAVVSDLKAAGETRTAKWIAKLRHVISLVR